MPVHGGLLAARDVLQYLYERAQQKDPTIKTQGDFADIYKADRAQMNQWLTGNSKPGHRTLREILDEEGLDIMDLIQPPSYGQAKAEHAALYAALDSLVNVWNEERLISLTKALEDLVFAARRQKDKGKSKPRQRSKEAEGQTARHEKRRAGHRDVAGKPPRAS